VALTDTSNCEPCGPRIARYHVPILYTGLRHGCRVGAVSEMPKLYCFFSRLAKFCTHAFRRESEVRMARKREAKLR